MYLLMIVYLLNSVIMDQNALCNYYIVNYIIAIYYLYFVILIFVAHHNWGYDMDCPY